MCKVQDQGDHEALPGGPSEIVPVCGLLTAIVSVNPQCWKPNEHPITQLHYRRDRYENVTLFWVETSVSGSLTHHDCKHEGLSQVQILWQKISNQLNYLQHNGEPYFDICLLGRRAGLRLTVASSGRRKAKTVQALLSLRPTSCSHIESLQWR